MLRAAGVDAPDPAQGRRPPAPPGPVRGAAHGALLASGRSSASRSTIETHDMAAFLESWQDNEGIDLLIGRWNADYDDPDNFTHTLFHSADGRLRDAGSPRRRPTGSSRRPAPRAGPPSARPCTGGSRACCSSRAPSCRSSTTSTTGSRAPGSAGLSCAAPRPTSTTPSSESASAAEPAPEARRGRRRDPPRADRRASSAPSIPRSLGHGRAGRGRSRASSRR